MVHAILCVCFFFEGDVVHLGLHVLTHSAPTLRSSDLVTALRGGARAPRRHACGIAGLCVRAWAVHPGRARDRRRRPSGRSSQRSEEHTSELQSLMRNSYAVFCLTKNRTIIE